MHFLMVARGFSVVSRWLLTGPCQTSPSSGLSFNILEHLSTAVHVVWGLSWFLSWHENVFVTFRLQCCYIVHGLVKKTIVTVLCTPDQMPLMSPRMMSQIHIFLVYTETITVLAFHKGLRFQVLKCKPQITVNMISYVLKICVAAWGSFWYGCILKGLSCNFILFIMNCGLSMCFALKLCLTYR